MFHFPMPGWRADFKKTDTPPPKGGTIVILHADDLEGAEKAVVNAGGKVINRFEFPGGRRFHFTDPSGNELAIWTKTE